jgi:NarL family two-component system sensor histidine kinase LiaS
LRPGSLQQTPLNLLLRHVCDAFSAKYSIPVVINFPPNGDDVLPAAVKESFYRITQEAFNNIGKHAQASRVEFHLEQTKTSLHLSIQDNGRGFDVTGQQPGRLGVQIMHERAAEANAILSIESTPDAGTTLTCQWTIPT